MGTTLLIHVIAGGLGLLSGYVALYVSKGGAAHRKSGILFVCVILTMAVSLRSPAFRAAGVLTPIAAMAYWLWRLRSPRRQARDPLVASDFARLPGT